MQWAVFEPNGPRLWANVRDAVSSFLYTEWRNGALLGANARAGVLRPLRPLDHDPGRSR